jgi:hypothetical protein
VKIHHGDRISRRKSRRRVCSVPGLHFCPWQQPGALQGGAGGGGGAGQGRTCKGGYDIWWRADSADGSSVRGCAGGGSGSVSIRPSGGLHGGRRGAQAQGKGRDGGAGGTRRRVGDTLVVAAYSTRAARAAGGWAGATRRPAGAAWGGCCAGVHAKMVRGNRDSRGRLGSAIRGGDAAAAAAAAAVGGTRGREAQVKRKVADLW